eukprot:TRINITY_DN17835_c0_g1_i1.p1 TRINITY_DN17835_c0_g1~~TRINITY_DN17835_c0_g1_i1.p1  ORF type:complete len:242 (-),score=17.09 TRINITY_DN17835_c0_g1_i1:245-970(-)
MFFPKLNKQTVTCQTCKLAPQLDRRKQIGYGSLLVHNSSIQQISNLKPGDFFEEQGKYTFNRRQQFLLFAEALICLSLQPKAQASSLKLFQSDQFNYQFEVPQEWEKKDKAGADVLFEFPQRRSTSVGVTVTPVRVNSLSEFGTMEAAGDRLMKIERAKDGVMDVRLLDQQTFQQQNPIYFYEYEENSTRGRKVVLNCVTIVDRKLYILNGQHKCEKSGCSLEDQEQLQLLRFIANTFRIL